MVLGFFSCFSGGARNEPVKQCSGCKDSAGQSSLTSKTSTSCEATPTNADIECTLHHDAGTTWPTMESPTTAKQTPMMKLGPTATPCEDAWIDSAHIPALMSTGRLEQGLISANCSVAGRFPSTFDVLSVKSNEHVTFEDLQGLTPAKRCVQVCATPAEVLRDITNMTFVSRGASSIVFQGTWQSATVAVKMLSSPKLTTQSVSVREALLGAELSHPNLVQCYTVRCMEVNNEMLQLATQQGAAKPDQELNRSATYDSEDGFGPAPSPPAPPLISWASLPTSPTGSGSAWNVILNRALYGPSSTGFGGNLSASTVGSTSSNACTQFGLGLSSLRPGQQLPSTMCSSRMAKSCGMLKTSDLLFCQGDASQEITSKRSKRASACQLHTPSPAPAEWMLPPATTWSAEGSRWSDVLQALHIEPKQVMVVMVCEWADLGVLSHVIHKEKLFVSPKDPKKDPRKLALRALLRTIREVALGLNHLHEAGVIHADVKPGNVVLSSSRMDRRGFVAKLTDLGLSRVCGTSEAFHLFGLPEEGCIENAEWGTTVYMAPEHLNGKLCKASDMYSVGVMMWEMCHACRPYAGHDRADVVAAVRADTATLVWETDRVHPAIVNLGKACLSYCPAVRPTCREFITQLVAIETMLRDEIARTATQRVSFEQRIVGMEASIA